MDNKYSHNITDTDIERKRAQSVRRQRVQWSLPEYPPAHMVGQWRTCECCGQRTAHEDCGWCAHTAIVVAG